MQNIFAGIIDCKMRPVQFQTNIELNPKTVISPDKILILFRFYKIFFLAQQFKISNDVFVE